MAAPLDTVEGEVQRSPQRSMLHPSRQVLFVTLVLLGIGGALATRPRGSREIKAARRSHRFSHHKAGGPIHSPVGKSNVLLEEGAPPEVGKISPEDPTFFRVHPSHLRSLQRPLKLPVLTVMFSLRSVAHRLRLSMPPGYQITSYGVDNEHLDCGIDISAAHSESLRGGEEMVSLVPHIKSCEFSTPEDPSDVPRLDIVLKRDFPGLSRELGDPAKAATRTLWYVKLQVQYPRASPSPESNVFELSWTSGGELSWEGTITIKAASLLGDWDCMYSDWQGWGECTARCGGGVMRLRRSILVEPPPGGTGKPCVERLVKEVSCNTHECSWPCVDNGPLETKEVQAQCTARCGGGVKVHRRHMTGRHCLSKLANVQDLHAVDLEECNDQPCKTKCQRTAQWRAVTECSEYCGTGFFWMLQEVVRKDPDDAGCVPLWRKQDCMRQACHAFTLVHYHRNAKPTCGRPYELGIIFDGSLMEHYKGKSGTEAIRRVKISAPKGYNFGAPKTGCTIFDSDLSPSTTCTVSSERNEILLDMLPSLKMPTRKQFVVALDHPGCRQDAARPDESLTVIVEEVDAASKWYIDFTPEVGEEFTLSAPGYQLQFPVDIDPANFVVQDWSTCTGDIRVSVDKVVADLCLDRVNKGDREVLRLAQCTKGSTQPLWMVPPTGNGNIVSAEKMTQCICVAGEPTVGTRVQLDDCNKRHCRWEMPSGRLGEIRLDSDTKLCMTVVGGPPEEGAEVGLGRCKHASFEASKEWLVPCAGVPELKEYSLSLQSGSGVLVRREAPTFCSPRIPCPADLQCNLEEGVCTSPS